MTSRRNLLMALLFLSAVGISAPLYARDDDDWATMMMTAEGVLADGKTEIN